MPSPERTPGAAPEFAEVYRALERIERPSLEAEQQGERVTLSVEGMPLVAFARMLADRASVSVVVSNRRDDRPVSLEVQDVTVGSVLALVARRLGVEITLSGGVYFIGELRPEDRGVYVRRVRRLDREGLTGAVETLLSQNGRVQAYDDGLVVVGDRVEVLHRVAELLDRVESAGADSWVVQLHMISTREADMSSFGLDVTPALDVAATFAAASNGAGPDGALNMGGALSAILEAERTSEAVDIVAAPLFVLVDGGTAELADGDELRVPQFSITDEGTQSVTGFEVVQTGLDVRVSLRDLGEGRARLELRTGMSAVVGFVADSLPQINTQRYETTAVVQSGGVYLLGSLERRSQVDGVDGPLRSVRRDEDEARTVFIWARAYRIGGDARPRERIESAPEFDDNAIGV